MKGRKRYLAIGLLMMVALSAWLLPVLLKAIPSRYVAAYLPAPVQALAERDHVEVLPTAATTPDIQALIEPSELDEPSVPTPLPPPLVVSEGPAEAPETPTPRPIELPQSTPTPTQTAIPIPSAARLESFFHQFQGWNNCGPATLAMSLSYFDIWLSQSDTAAVLKPNPEDRNVSPYEMAAYVNEETELRAIDRTNGDLDTLRRLLASGFPVIIELGLDPPGEYRWMGWYGHYLLVVAYDDRLGQVWVYDSWFGTSEVPAENADSAGRIIKYGELDRYWRQFNRSYITLYRQEEADRVAEIIGPNMDDDAMWARSLVRVQEEIRDEPEDAFLWFNLGTVYNALGNYERAAAAFDQARASELPWRMLWYQFGPYEAYYQVGRYEDVILLADVTLQDRPYFEESYYYKGLAQAELGQEAQARTNLEKAVRFNPNFAPAAVALAGLG